jgi:hypothetical protein
LVEFDFSIRREQRVGQRFALGAKLGRAASIGIEESISNRGLIRTILL